MYLSDIFGDLPSLGRSVCTRKDVRVFQQDVSIIEREMLVVERFISTRKRYLLERDVITERGMCLLYLE